MRPDWFRYRTHCQVLGTSQSGKSKFVEANAEACIMAGMGVTIIDMKGTLYRNVLDWCSVVRPLQPIYLLDLSGGDYVTPFRVFQKPETSEISAHVERMAETITKAWGHNIDDMPTFEDAVTMTLTFCAELGEPIQHGLKLLDRRNVALRNWAYSEMRESVAKSTLYEIMNAVSKTSEWRTLTKSTSSRMNRLVGSRPILRCIGLPPSVGAHEVIAENAVLLVNLAPRAATLSRKAARAFASLLLSEFLTASLDLSGSPVPHFMFCDEANVYLNDDAAPLLDLALQSGMRCTFVHHHDLQLKGDDLQMSMQTNARIRCVFDGLPVIEAKRYAEEYFLAEINEPEVMETRVRGINVPYEEGYQTLTEHGEEVSSTSGTRWAPDVEFIEDNVYFTREQQVSMRAGRFSLPPRTCLIRLPDRIIRHEVPEVRSWGDWTNPEDRLQYIKSLHLLHGITAEEADKRIAELEARFAERTKDAPVTGTGRTKVKVNLQRPR